MKPIAPPKNRLESGLRRSWRAAVSGLLCVLLVDLPLLAENRRPFSGANAGAATSRLDHRQRTLHALNRLTFGPRPGEVEEVERIGLQRWFENQLNPETIDDSALESRLAAYPAMRLPQAELMERYPSPQKLRTMIGRGDPLPRDPVEHAIYADDIAFFQAAQARKKAGSNEDPDGRREARGRNGMEAGASAPADANTAAQPMSAAGAEQSSAQANDDSTQPNPNRGRKVHDDAAFPEARTAEILDLAPDARVARLLALAPADLVNFRHSLSQAELVRVGRDLSPQQKETFAALQGSARMIGAEVLQSRIERDIYSKRQMEAVMTDFWLNHFNVYVKKNQNEPYLLPAYEREAIRPHALGRFEDLLIATAKSPAMLVYLDNWQSIGPDSDAAQRGKRLANTLNSSQRKQATKDRGLNENYARELMELHTLGVGCEVSQDHTAAELDPACGKGYTQADVTEVAKVFSGWTIDRPADGGEYKFEERRHEPGKKKVLGETIAESGEREGLEVLHQLAISPATARFLSTKLAVRFVSDTPPASLVDRMTRSYLESGGDIRSVLRTMFAAPEFWSPAVYRTKVKTPLEFVASAMRATDAEVTNALPLVQSLDRLGMPLYGMQTPNGYSWKSEPWVSTGALVSRMNFALVLSAEKLPGTRIGWPSLIDRRPPVAEPAAMTVAGQDPSVLVAERQLEGTLLGIPASDRTRQAVLTQAADSSVPRQAEQEFLPGRTEERSDTPNQQQGRGRPGASAFAGSQTAAMVGLLLGSPEFQRR